MPGKSKDATNTAELKKFEFKKDNKKKKPSMMAMAMKGKR